IYTDKSVYDFAISPDKASVVYSTNIQGKFAVKHVTIGKNLEVKDIQLNSDKKFMRLTWSKNSKAVAFLKFEEKASALCYYRLSDKKSVVFGPKEQGDFPDNLYIDPVMKIEFSPDTRQIFLRTRQIESNLPDLSKSDIQVWNAADKFIYTNEKLVKGWTLNPKICMYTPDSGYYKFLTDKLLPQGFLIPSAKYIISYNVKDYEPQQRRIGDVDYYITNINSDEKNLLLRKSSSDDVNPYISPKGNSVFYFLNNAWHSYNADSEKHQNLTPEFKEKLYWIQYVDVLNPYGLEGVTADGKELLFYDEYDLWAAKLDGTGVRRLTKGREKGIIFRAIPQSEFENVKYDRRPILGSYDLANGIVLSGKSPDNFKNGVFFLKGNVVKQLAYVDKSINYIVKAKHAEVFAWIEESFNSPPMIILSDRSKGVKILRETNPQHSKFFGKAPDVVNYSWNGKILHGILYYPANYKPGTKYPMVLNIYEKQSQNLRKFLMPSQYNSGVINVCNLTAKGYFVLLPDIEYKTGYIGNSALECVEAAVFSALQNKDIDSSRIGISGSSFGGFETNYIISKSKIFACAIAGCAPTNFVSNYLSEAIDSHIPNYFQMEQQQGRMGGSLFENQAAYLRNSPVLLASGVTTPLLSWTGLKDHQVHYTQSFEMYMALRRLGKEHILLAVPEEGHAIWDRRRDADLTEKMQQWLDYYL
ncbi:MAG: hypothetical protein EOO20_19760, partial [Chryseobacterium sp.]